MAHEILNEAAKTVGLCPRCGDQASFENQHAYSDIIEQVWRCLNCSAEYTVEFQHPRVTHLDYDEDDDLREVIV